MSKKIAFLGMGLMGAPMARRLHKAGLNVTIWNRNPDKLAALVAEGMTSADSPVAAAQEADIVITMLTDGDAVGHVLFDQGVAETLLTGAVVIDMSSIRPEQARAHAQRLAEHGIHHLDAPVSGGEVGAREGSLAIMAGGDADQIAAVADVLQHLGRVTRVGPSGSGQLAKLANQQIVAITIGAIAEAMVLVEKGGGSPAAFRDAIRGGFCESRILELHGKRMIERKFAPGGTSAVQLKDLNNIVAEAEGLALTLPLTETTRSAFRKLVDGGHGHKDHSALLLQVEHINGIADRTDG